MLDKNAEFNPITGYSLLMEYFNIKIWSYEADWTNLQKFLMEGHDPTFRAPNKHTAFSLYVTNTESLDPLVIRIFGELLDPSEMQRCFILHLANPRAQMHIKGEESVFEFMNSGAEIN